MTETKNAITMTRHTVTVADMEAWRNELIVQTAASFGRGEAKSLSMSLNGKRFVVMDHAVEIYHGPSLEAAVAAYNEA